MSSGSGYPGFVEDRAIVEVGKMLGAVLKHGAYYSVVFDNPVTQAVIAHYYGGWKRLCSGCNTQMFRREFVRTWMAYYRQGVTLFGHLPGFIETTNRKIDDADYIPSPERIGDPHKAHFVLTAKG